VSEAVIDGGRPEAPVGRARGPVDVSMSADGLDIMIPRRRTRQRTLLGLLVTAPFAFQALRVAVMLVVTLLGSGSAEEAVSLIGMVGASFMLGLLGQTPAILAVLFGLHILFGSTAVEVRPTRVVVRLTLGKLRVYFNGTDLRPGSWCASALLDQAGRWLVKIDPGVAMGSRVVRPLLIGGGDLSRSQAEDLAKAMNGIQASQAASAPLDGVAGRHG